MNYFITHCDKNFLIYAERLFEMLSSFSDNKIIFYSIDFDYKSKFKNVISIKFDSKKQISSANYFKYNDSNWDINKAYHVFLKPFIVQKILSNNNYKNDNFCYIDADCLPISNCDLIFDKIKKINNYPLLNKCCHEYMLMNGKGDPFINNSFNIELCLEADMMKLLNIDLSLRKKYLQTGVFLFNKNCIDFINKWCEVCTNPDILNNWQRLAPFHEETVINCLLWKNKYYDNLDQSLINLPYNEYNAELSISKIKEMINCLNNADEKEYFIDTFCYIPKKENLKNLYFYHGKISESEYNFIKENMSERYLLKVNSQSLGDTLAVTPTLRKLYNSYNKKIDIITHHVELFKNNKYINNIYNFSDKINEKIYTEIFNTFLGVGGEKNKYGVEKKHNTIDIRQYHAIDLGFMLNEKEMQYDYTPDKYVNIENLPSDYVCLHVANTWPSRTYSDENWQTLIDLINKNNLSVVLIGKNGHETGFFNVDKPTKKLNFTNGIDLTNKLNLSQCWHVINKSKYFITMDSGLLHLAGTTDCEIIQLGSSINNKLRAPYRYNNQLYKYKYIGGSCDLFCASDIKYGVKEWKTIQGIPPLITCLENKTSYECHPKPQQIIDYIFDKNSDKTSIIRKKFLFIAPHLSTGGSPKYLEWLISQKIREGYDVKVIEWNLYSDIYIVQRNSIINMIGVENFYSVCHYTEEDTILNDKVLNLIKIIKEYNPDYIHLNEYSENFAIKNLTDDFISFLYNKDRTHKIYETTHSSRTNILDKKNIPDELWLVSDYQYKIAKNSNIPSKLVEMQIENNVRPDRSATLHKLSLDPYKLHVLQVGLFCNNKNQKFTFDLAKNLLQENVQFHFIGNKCYIDECNLDQSLENCKIWDERSDVDLFMSCMDVFVLPSLEELNPIALKEALSWDMKCFISKIKTLEDQYKNNNKITFLDEKNLHDYIKDNCKNFHKLTSFNISSERSEPNQIISTFFPTPKIEILGNESILYNVKFIDEDTGIIHYQSTINTNMWTSCSISYFCKWKILIYNYKYGIVTEIKLDLKNKNIKIINESNSLGDSISWMAAIDIFQKTHNCKIDYHTCNKSLFEKIYTNINFYDYSAKIKKDYYAQYKIGCFDKNSESDLIKIDWRKLSLQEIAFVALGLDYTETKSKIHVSNKFKINFKKYICIATQSTSQSRYWNYKDGWFKIIEYLKNLGYKIVCVDKHYQFGKDKFINTCPANIDYFAGDHSLDEIIDIINGCEFFIGLSSGLSWLSWALNKDIIKINNSVTNKFEFYTPYIVSNNHVCNGCFNNIKYKFDASNWSWCPEDKNFECSTNISPKDVIEKIDLLINVKNCKFNKIKIVHLQTTINSQNEIASRNFIEKFNKFGITYVNYQNEIDNTDAYLKNCLYPGLLNSDKDDQLNSKHYGCYNSFKTAIKKEFTDDIDFLIICEGDCLFECSHEQFLKILQQIVNICQREDISYFSFGDTHTLESRILQSNQITVPSNQDLCYITDKIIGIQSIMLSKNIKNILITDLDNEPWYIMDGWFNEFCWRNNKKMGIVKNRLTTQYSGESFINNRIKIFNK